MSDIKTKMIQVIQSIPENSTYDEILQALCIFRMIEKGLADSKAGRTISTENLKQEMRKW